MKTVRKAVDIAYNVTIIVDNKKQVSQIIDVIAKMENDIFKDNYSIEIDVVHAN